MRYFTIVLLFLASAQAAIADETYASEASVRQLIEVTQARKLLDGTMAQMDSMLQTSVKQSLQGKTFNAEQQAILDDMQKQMVAVFQDEMRWEVLEPKFIDIYRKSFSEQEVAGMLDFYSSPAGRAVITKMPLVMQHTMQMMQQSMSAMMPRVQEIEAEATAKLKACCKQDG